MIGAVAGLVFLVFLPVWIIAAASLPEPQCYALGAAIVPLALVAFRSVTSWSRGTR